MSSGIVVILVLFLCLSLLWLVWLGFRAHETNWGQFWLNVLDGWIRLFLKYYHRYQYTPIELPEQGAALLAGNHVSGLDPLMMMAACRRPVRFMIAREEYERFGLRWLFRAGGCIPVERSGNPEKAFREALAALERGEVVGIFPEGGIHLSSHPPKHLKRGVAVLAELSGARVYPVRVSGAAVEGEALRAVFKRGRARLQALAPMDCAALGQSACLQQLGKILREN